MMSVLFSAIVNICYRADITRFVTAKFFEHFGWTGVVAFLSPDVLDFVQNDLRFTMSYVRFFFIGGMFIQRGIFYSNWSFEGPDQFAFTKDVFIIFWLSVAGCTFEDVVTHYICLYRKPPLKSVFGQLDKNNNSKIKIA